MRIALLGYGNMGKEIERLVNEEKKHEIVSVSFGSGASDKIDGKVILNADVVIDFTSAKSVLDNIEKVSSLGRNMVVGTTGWYENLEKVKKIVKEKGIGFIYSPNFSIGANIYLRLVAQAARLLSQFKNYDVYGFEIHHSGKKDSPSGTALKIAQEILKNFPNKKVIQTEKLARKINPDELHFASVRGGRNPGHHQIVFDSNADEITISHSAHNREGFARGAILAAEFIKDKKGFYTFDEVLSQKVE